MTDGINIHHKNLFRRCFHLQMVLHSSMTVFPGKIDFVNRCSCQAKTLAPVKDENTLCITGSSPSLAKGG
jgi:hypothetical protein